MLGRSRSLCHSYRRHLNASDLDFPEEFRREVSQEVSDEEAVEFEDEEEEEEDAMMSDVAVVDSGTREDKQRAHAIARLEGSFSASRPSLARLRGCRSETDVRRLKHFSEVPRGGDDPDVWKRGGKEEEEGGRRKPTLAQRRGVGVASIVKAERLKLELSRPKLVLLTPNSPSFRYTCSSSPSSPSSRSPSSPNSTVHITRKVRSSSRLVSVPLSPLTPQSLEHAKRVSLAEVLAEYTKLEQVRNRGLLNALLSGGDDPRLRRASH